MITKIKLNIYVKYHGDIDAFSRIGTDIEKQILNDKDWIFIDDLIQDIRLSKNHILSKERESELHKKIERNLEDKDTLKILYDIVENISN